MSYKGKQFVDLILIPAIIILVGVAAFGFGRLSALKDSKGGLVIHSSSEVISQ